MIDKQSYRAQRLAILYITGEWPKGEVHHKNHIKDDNREDNLQDVAHVENVKDKLKNKNNTSGYKGVSWNKKRQKWTAGIWIDGKRIHLGYFNIAKEAHDTYCKAAVKYFGEFARFV